MSDVARIEAPLRLRHPLFFTWGVAGFLAVLGYTLQLFTAAPAQTLVPWEVAALLAALVLWSTPTLEACSVACARRGKDWIGFTALAFAYGYFWTVCLLLAQWGSAQLAQTWVVFGIIGQVFGYFIARSHTSAQVEPMQAHFLDRHALDRAAVVRICFVLWPAVSVAALTFGLLAPASLGVTISDFPVLMLMVLVLWPMSYDITPGYRPVYLSNVGLGGALILAVALL